MRANVFPIIKHAQGMEDGRAVYITLQETDIWLTSVLKPLYKAHVLKPLHKIFSFLEQHSSFWGHQRRQRKGDGRATVDLGNSTGTWCIRSVEVSHLWRPRYLLQDHDLLEVSNLAWNTEKAPIFIRRVVKFDKRRMINDDKNIVETWVVWWCAIFTLEKKSLYFVQLESWSNRFSSWNVNKTFHLSLLSFLYLFSNWTCLELDKHMLPSSGVYPEKATELLYKSTNSLNNINLDLNSVSHNFV